MALVTTATALLLLLRFDPGTSPGAQGVSADATISGGTDAATSGASRASAQLTGDAVGTRFGTVQVQVTVENGTLVDVTALKLPMGGRDSQVSAYAEPILRSEALKAGSARIDTGLELRASNMSHFRSS